MASTSPSPNSSPSAVPPTSANTSPPPPSSPSSTNSSRPPPPRAVPSTPPPSRSLSPPPSSPPDSPPASPPPSATTAPPPIETSAAPPNLSPPPAVAASPPPHASNVPPAENPPPSEPISPTPPPPANVSTPPSSSSPSPTPAKPPESTPSPPSHTLPPSGSESPPSTNASPPSTPSVPSTSSPPPKHAPPTHASAVGGPPPPKSSIPTEKPTAKSSNGTNKSTNGAPSHPGGLVLVIGIVVGFVVISLLVMAMWFIQKRKRKETGSKVGYTMPSPYSSSQNSGTMFLRTQSPFSHNGSGSNFMYSPSEASGVSISRSWFTYEELFQATNGFSAQNLLGEGGFGCVYKGFLIDGREVAVKQLKDGGGQGEREFGAEVEIISRVHHRHLVSLVGYCISEHQRLLVYDYVPNNTLHYHLHGGGRPVIDWATRVKVAAGAARGIAYLHEDCYPRIIHRDIKSSNILLDNNFEAQVSDFGLAKLAMDSFTHVTTRVMGTFGYMAPEYATSGKLTEKSDVYSFGVVLLELITGRKPVDASRPIGEESVVEWARPLLIQALNNENFEILVDPRLEKNYNRNEMFRMIEAAAACVRHSSAKRPQMSQVVRALDSLDDISDLCNGMKPGQSAIFNPSPPSAQIRMFQRMVSGIGSQDYSSSFFNDSQSSWRSREQDSKHHDLPK